MQHRNLAQVAFFGAACRMVLQSRKAGDAWFVRCAQIEATLSAVREGLEMPVQVPRERAGKLTDSCHNCCVVLVWFG